MDDSRIPKWTFYGQLENGMRRQGGQLKRYKDNLKNILNQCGIPSSDIESLAKQRTELLGGPRALMQYRTSRTGVSIH